MGSQTQNYGLFKPDRTDYVSVITDLNNNFDIIDESIKSVETTLSSRMDAVHIWQGLAPNDPLSTPLSIYPVDLREYRSLVVAFKSETSATTLRTLSVDLLTGEGTTISKALLAINDFNASSAAIEMSTRPLSCTIASTGYGSITFGTHATLASISSSGVALSQNDYKCIPYAIYGIKK